MHLVNTPRALAQCRRLLKPDGFLVDGPSSGRVASQIAVSAESSISRMALGPPISVLTQPGHMEYSV